MADSDLVNSGKNAPMPFKGAYIKGIDEVRRENISEQADGYVDDNGDVFFYDFADERTIFDNPTSDPDSFTVKDAEWISRAFLVPDSAYGARLDSLNASNAVLNGRYFSTASLKHTNTSLGGNFGINSRPQFTRYSDVRLTGRLETDKQVGIDYGGETYGLGRYYSEAIDDNAETIVLSFGVPKHNSMANFFIHVWDPEVASVARRGRTFSSTVHNFFRDTANLVTNIFLLRKIPIIALSMFSLQFASSFGRSAATKYYTMKPTMHNYWWTAQGLLNAMMINLGLYPSTHLELVDDLIGDGKADIKDEAKRGAGSYAVPDQAVLDFYKSVFPNLFNKSEMLDIYAIGTRAMRQEMGHIEEMEGIGENEFEQYFSAKVNANDSKFETLMAFMARSLKVDQLYGKGTSSEQNVFSDVENKEAFEKYADMDVELDPRLNASSGSSLPRGEENSFLSEISTYYSESLRKGSDYVFFKVNAVKSVNESFDNSVGESGISSFLNSTSTSSRDLRFNLADGNLTGIDAVDGLLKGAVGAVTGIASGVIDSVTFGASNILGVLTGAGFVDIPKTWQNSSARLPEVSYSISLVSPYGNVMSLLQNIYVPMALLMAGSLPLSTGKNSYTSPFLCRIFHRGKNMTRLGMITSLSFTRGTTHLPFTNKGQVLGVDVSFTITDLSSIMHVPINQTIGVFTDAPEIDEGSTLYDYLAAITGQSLYDHTNPISVIRQRIAKRAAQVGVFTSPAYWGSLGASFTNDITFGLASAFGDTAKIFSSRPQ